VPASRKANSEAAQPNKTGVKKATAQPQAISGKTWEAIKLACVGGMGFSEAARAFGINNAHTVIMKARRNHWPIPARVQERVESLQALQAARYKAQEKAREQRCNGDQALETLAQDWVSRGERHRSLVYGLASSALKNVAKCPPPLESWGDIEKADRAGRRACGLDDSEAARTVSVGMQLIEFRLANIHLPPDALKEPPEDTSRVAHGQDVTDARL
jgi:hypothetical protein